MPNYCYSRLKMPGVEKEKLQEILDYIKSDDHIFDFNKVIPMPDHVFKGDLGPQVNLFSEDNWYGWSCNNWGTKWNACYSRVDGDSIYFWTAWSPCLPVVKELSRIFPDVPFVLSFVDEGGGFSGKENYYGGEIVSGEEYDMAVKHIVEEVGLKWNDWIDEEVQ